MLVRVVANCTDFPLYLITRPTHHFLRHWTRPFRRLNMFSWTPSIQLSISASAVTSLRKRCRRCFYAFVTPTWISVLRKASETCCYYFGADRFIGVIVKPISKTINSCQIFERLYYAIGFRSCGKHSLICQCGHNRINLWSAVGIVWGGRALHPLWGDLMNRCGRRQARITPHDRLHSIELANSPKSGQLNTLFRNNRFTRDKSNRTISKWLLLSPGWSIDKVMMTS